jgi:hypothetical protein
MAEANTGEGDWALDAARLFSDSASGMGLKVPIEAVADVFRQIETIDIDLSGIERVYNTEETAQFLGKSSQWMYWALKPRAEGGGGQFTRQIRDPDTDEVLSEVPIEPERIGKTGIRRYTLKVIQEMGVSMHQHATIDFDELKEIVRRVQLARLGRWQPVVKKKTKRKRKKTEAIIHHGPEEQGAD